MNKQSQFIGDIAKEYCKKFPSVSNRQLARSLFEKYPEAFKNVEHARSIVRYARGQNGYRSRGPLCEKIKRIVPKADHQEDWSEYKVTQFPVAVCGDMHMPYHDEEAVGLFINHCVDINAKTIILNGDCMDCYQVSRWGKNPKYRDFPGEIAMMKKFIYDLHDLMPDAKIVYKVGNHEERYEKYLQDHCVALFGLEEIKLKNLLGATESWIDWVDNKRVIVADGLHIIHGHEYVFNISNPVNPARGLYTRAKKSAMCFHFHQTSEHTETAIDGELSTCWSVGCLCNLRPEYMPLNKWNHGFAVIENDNGKSRIHNYRILNGEIL